MKVILGVDVNTYYLAITQLCNDGSFWDSATVPKREVWAPWQKAKGKAKPSATERLRAMYDVLHDEFASMTTDELEAIGWVYIEDVPMVGNARVLKEMQAVVTMVMTVCWSYGINVSLINNQTWKRETIGDAKADKTTITNWAKEFISGCPNNLIEDQYDAAVIAYRGAKAVGAQTKAA